MITKLTVGYDNLYTEKPTLFITGDSINEAKEYINDLYDGIKEDNFTSCIFRDDSDTANVKYTEI